MDEKIRDLLERIRGTAADLGETAAPAARYVGQRAGELVDTAKLNIQIFDRNSEINDLLRRMGKVMYDTHLGKEPTDDVTELLRQADDAYAQIADLKAKVAALRQGKTTNMGSLFKLTYDLVLKDDATEKTFIDELRRRNGNLEISMSHQETAAANL